MWFTMSHILPGYQGAALFWRRAPGIDPMSPLCRVGGSEWFPLAGVSHRKRQ
jgi:hypothetical protein